MADELRGLTDLVGSRLPKDLKSRHGAVILPKETILTAQQAEKALRHEIDDLPMIEPDYDRIIGDTELEMRAIFRQVQASHSVPIQELRATVIPTILYLSEQPDVRKLLHHLHAHDAYTVQHSIAVGIIATFLGRALGIEGDDLEQLSIAATIHDIGKLLVPCEVLNKPGVLTDQEFAVMKQHTIHGFRIIESTQGMSTQHALVALLHHERMDGSGYPHRLQAEDIGQWARIVAVADVFHAMMSNRVYKRALPLFEIMREFEKGRTSKYDKQVTDVFLDRMSRLIVGREIVLSDGRVGTIVSINRGHPLAPVIETGNEIIDLSKEESLAIQELIGNSMSA